MPLTPHTDCLGAKCWVCPSYQRVLLGRLGKPKRFCSCMASSDFGIYWAHNRCEAWYWYPFAVETTQDWLCAVWLGIGHFQDALGKCTSMTETQTETRQSAAFFIVATNHFHTARQANIQYSTQLGSLSHLPVIM